MGPNARALRYDVPETAAHHAESMQEETSRERRGADGCGEGRACARSTGGSRATVNDDGRRSSTQAGNAIDHDWGKEAAAPTMTPADLHRHLTEESRRLRRAQGAARADSRDRARRRALLRAVVSWRAGWKGSVKITPVTCTDSHRPVNGTERGSDADCISIKPFSDIAAESVAMSPVGLILVSVTSGAAFKTNANVMKRFNEMLEACTLSPAINCIDSGSQRTLCGALRQTPKVRNAFAVVYRFGSGTRRWRPHIRPTQTHRD